MTTLNSALDITLTGQTGTGHFVGSTSPTLITPGLGAATATSLTLSSTTGIVGTTTNNNAAAGSVGEIISSVIALASAVSLTTATPANITNISLTAGDWDVYGNVTINYGGTCGGVATWASTTSATLPDASLYTNINSAEVGGGMQGLCVPFIRISIATTTTVYLSVQASFSTSTCTGCGGIFARRVR